MSTRIKISADNLLNISAKLDTLDLSVEEKGLLSAVFQAAGCELCGDVSGFALDAGLGLGGSFAALFGHAGSDGVVAGGGVAGVGGVVGTNGQQTGGLISVPGVGNTSFLIGQ